MDLSTTLDFKSPFQRLKYVVLVGTSIFGSCFLFLALFLGGTGTLGLIAAGLLRSLTPDSQHFSLPVVLDYSKSHELSAVLELLPEERRSSKVSWAGRTIDAWIDMRMAEMPPNCQAFNVHVETVAADGRTLRAVSRWEVPACRSLATRALRAALTMPLVLVGIMDEDLHLRIHLLRRHRENRTSPAVLARLSVRGRGDNPAPEFHSATLHIELRLGLIARLMYFVRHNLVLFSLLIAAAFACLAGSVCCGAAGLAALFASASGSSAGAAWTSTANEADEDDDGSSAGEDIFCAEPWDAVAGEAADGPSPTDGNLHGPRRRVRSGVEHRRT
uniref:Seipin n=1 Tax=Tetraselmis sp. GSL018 TaxID=582737 RepID=A0A061S8U8_9CHLO